MNHLTDMSASRLVDALKINSTLTRLSLKGNQMDDAAATQLSDLLRFNMTLLSLDLANTGMTENGISSLSAALSVNATLIHLNLRSNTMTEAATTQLCHALTVNSFLTTLDFRSCNLDESQLTRLSEYLAGNLSLTRLEVGANFSSSALRKRMMKTLSHNRLQRVHELFQNVPTLTSLKLALQPINHVGAAQLGEALAINSCLKALYLRCKIIGHGMTSSSYCGFVFKSEMMV